MSASPIAEVAVYLLYSVLSCTAVLVLFASAVALIALAVRIIIREIQVLMGTTTEAHPSAREPRIKTLDPVGVGVGNRARQIRGAHNERF